MLKHWWKTKVLGLVATRAMEHLITFKSIHYKPLMKLISERQNKANAYTHMQLWDYIYDVVGTPISKHPLEWEVVAKERTIYIREESTNGYVYDEPSESEDTHGLH